MSCIKEILNLKGERDYLVIGKGIAIESGGEYRGYDYIITFAKFGHRCGYIAISADHPLYSNSIIDLNFDVHGGITFFEKHDLILNELLGKITCADKWLGFDSAYCEDEKDLRLAKKLWKESAILKEIEAQENFDNKFREMSDRQAKIKTKEYMENQCKNLIDQISAMSYS